MNNLFYGEYALETIANNILKNYDLSLICGDPRAIPIEEIMEDAFGLNIEYQYIRNNGRILGQLLFEDGYAGVYDKTQRRYIPVFFKSGTVLIDGSLCENDKTAGRLRFTLSHELAHYVIHKKIYMGSDESAAHIEKSDTLTERQANYLGSAILMPKGQVKKCFYQLQASCRDKRNIIEKMARIFEVSKQSMKIRLEGFGLL